MGNKSDKYEILENKMSSYMSNKIIDISKSAFYDKKYTWDRSEYIKYKRGKTKLTFRKVFRK